VHVLSSGLDPARGEFLLEFTQVSEVKLQQCSGPRKSGLYIQENYILKIEQELVLTNYSGNYLIDLLMPAKLKCHPFNPRANIARCVTIKSKRHSAVSYRSTPSRPVGEESKTKKVLGSENVVRLRL
jgi:hypothetical protein